MGQELVASSRRCPEEDKESLVTPVSIKELRDIVKELKKQSSPGPLGLSNTLLKFLFPHISHLLVQAGNDLLFGEDDIEIPKWLYHRIVLFVLKPGKNVTDPDSYRGLSMLENIYKMYSKLIALRMASPLRYIQSPQQFGFTKDKGCLEASRSVIDAIRAANLEGLPMIVLSTDFYKAFDSIALDHVESCLKFYEFPDSFTTAFMRLTRGGTMQFKVKNMLSMAKKCTALPYDSLLWTAKSSTKLNTYCP